MRFALCRSAKHFDVAVHLNVHLFTAPVVGSTRCVLSICFPCLWICAMVWRVGHSHDHRFVPARCLLILVLHRMCVPWLFGNEHERLLCSSSLNALPSIAPISGVMSCVLSICSVFEDLLVGVAEVGIHTITGFSWHDVHSCFGTSSCVCACGCLETSSNVLGARSLLFHGLVVLLCHLFHVPCT